MCCYAQYIFSGRTIWNLVCPNYFPSDRNMETTIHRNVLARNIRGCVGQQEADRLDHLFWLRPTSHRNPSQNAVAKFVAPDRFRPRGFDHAETYRIRTDAKLRPLLRGGHGHPKKPALCCGVVDLADCTGPPCG